MDRGFLGDRPFTADLGERRWQSFGGQDVIAVQDFIFDGSGEERLELSEVSWKTAIVLPGKGFEGFVNDAGHLSLGISSLGTHPALKIFIRDALAFGGTDP